MVRRFSAFLLLIVFFLNPIMLLSQSRGDFHDSYDYDLRRYNPSADLEKFEEYKLPPEYEKNPPITPKFVQPPTNPFGFLPTDSIVNPSKGEGSLGQRRTGNRINPVTGEVEVQPIYEQQRKEKDKKPKKKLIAEYKETKARRTQIIFFLTFPFAAGLMAGIVFFAGSLNRVNYLNTAPGAIIMVTGATALSFVNVNMDRKRVDEIELQKKSNMSLNQYMNPHRQFFSQTDYSIQLFNFTKSF